VNEPGDQRTEQMNETMMYTSERHRSSKGGFTAMIGVEPCFAYLLKVGRSIRTGEAIAEATIAPAAMNDLRSMMIMSEWIESTRAYVVRRDKDANGAVGVSEGYIVRELKKPNSPPMLIYQPCLDRSRDSRHSVHAI
jgi:hypothetical protein